MLALSLFCIALAFLAYCIAVYALFPFVHMLWATIKIFISSKFTRIASEVYSMLLQSLIAQLYIMARLLVDAIVADKLLGRLSNGHHVAKLHGLARLAAFEKLGMRLENAEDTIGCGNRLSIINAPSAGGHLTHKRQLFTQLPQRRNRLYRLSAGITDKLLGYPTNPINFFNKQPHAAPHGPTATLLAAMGGNKGVEPFDFFIMKTIFQREKWRYSNSLAYKPSCHTVAIPQKRCVSGIMHIGFAYGCVDAKGFTGNLLSLLGIAKQKVVDFLPCLGRYAFYGGIDFGKAHHLSAEYSGEVAQYVAIGDANDKFSEREPLDYFNDNHAQKLLTAERGLAAGFRAWPAQIGMQGFKNCAIFIKNIANLFISLLVLSDNAGYSRAERKAWLSIYFVTHRDFRGATMGFIGFVTCHYITHAIPIVNMQIVAKLKNIPFMSNLNRN